MKEPNGLSDEEYAIAIGAPPLGVPVPSLGGLKWNKTKTKDFEDPDFTQQLKAHPFTPEEVAHPPTPEEAFAAKMRRKRGEGTKGGQFKVLSSLEAGERIHQNIADLLVKLGREFRDHKSPLYGWKVGEPQGGGEVSITPPDRLLSTHPDQVDAAQARLHGIMGR